MTSADDIEVSFVPRRSSAIASVDVEGETVIFQTSAETIHVLNPSASAVWTIIDGATDVETLALDLSDAFGVPPAVMLEQVHEIICEFGRQGLLDGVLADEQTVEQIRLDLLRSTEIGSEIRDE